jgi:diacylglycerol kinase family enzyme
MRALVVANPNATSTSPRDRDILARALGSEVKLEVAETNNRGHAAALACRAMRDRWDLVVAMGGDGTVNEVVNGLLTDGVHEHVPALGVVPAGSTNVFARALGIPNDPLQATGVLLESLRENRQRRIGLGRAEDRWFTFAAGFGYDAAVVAAVERRRRRGKRSTHSLYARTAIREFFRSDRSDPALVLERPDGTAETGLFFAIVTNVSPWTYLGNHPLNPTPEASFDSGLDVYARRRMGTLGVIYGLAQTVRNRPHIRGRGTYQAHDLPGFVLRSSRPLPFQVDGDHLGERESIRFWAIPSALAVHC